MHEIVGARSQRDEIRLGADMTGVKRDGGREVSHEGCQSNAAEGSVHFGGLEEKGGLSYERAKLDEPEEEKKKNTAYPGWRTCFVAAE